MVLWFPWSTHSVMCKGTCLRVSHLSFQNFFTVCFCISKTISIILLSFIQTVFWFLIAIKFLSAFLLPVSVPWPNLEDFSIYYFDSWGQSSNSRRLKMINAKQTGRQLTQSLSCFVFSNDDSDPGVLQILRFGNSAWDLSGVNFSVQGFFFGFWFFAPIQSSPSLEIRTIPPPPTPQGQWQQWECQKCKFIKLKLCTCTKLFGTFLSWPLLNYCHDKFSSAMFQRHRKHTIWRVILSYITLRCGP